MLGFFSCTNTFHRIQDLASNAPSKTDAETFTPLVPIWCPLYLSCPSVETTEVEQKSCSLVYILKKNLHEAHWSLSWTQQLKEEDVKSLPGWRARHACGAQTAPDAATNVMAKEARVALVDGLLLFIHQIVCWKHMSEADRIFLTNTILSFNLSLSEIKSIQQSLNCDDARNKLQNWQSYRHFTQNYENSGFPAEAWCFQMFASFKILLNLRILLVFINCKLRQRRPLMMHILVILKHCIASLVCDIFYLFFCNNQAQYYAHGPGSTD